MRPLSASELLNAWEKSLSEPPSTRALALLSAACSDVEPQVLARLSIGERDARLLTLREWAFGGRLDSVADCAKCGERLEWTVEADQLRAAAQTEPVADLSLEADGYHVVFRLPNTLDLAAAAVCGDVSSARRVLFEHCILTTSRDGQQITAAELPRNVEDSVVKQMSQADPQADTQLDLTCPACSHRWQAVFDIESFFWGEISAWARRLLHEVHTLASAYGWRESDILNLSPWRRQLYLNLVNG